MLRTWTRRSAVGPLLAVLLTIFVPAVYAQQAEPGAAPVVAPEEETEEGLTEAEKAEVSRLIAQSLGSIRLNYAFQLYFQKRDTGSGPDGTGSTSDIYFRRNRLMLSGQLDDVYGFYSAIQFQGDERIYPFSVAETPGKDIDVIDTYFTADYADFFRLRAGLTKDPMLRESNESCFEPLSVDRSYFAYTNLSRLNRDFGLLLWGNIAHARVQYRVAAMKGNDDVNDPKNSLRYTARVHVSLLDPEHSILYKSAYLGRKKVLTLGAGYQTESDAVYGDLAARNGAKDYKAFTYDAFVEYPTPVGTFTASAAYLETDFDNAYKGGDPDPRSIGLYGEKNGWYAKAGYLLPMKIGPGSLQIFGRSEEWKFADLGGLMNQEVKWAAYGVNYYLSGQDLRLTLESSSNDYVKEDAANKDFRTVTLMMQVRI